MAIAGDRVLFHIVVVRFVKSSTIIFNCTYIHVYSIDIVERTMMTTTRFTETDGKSVEGEGKGEKYVNGNNFILIYYYFNWTSVTREF